MSKPTIAVSMGDPVGVGPEICFDLLSVSRVFERRTFVVIGDRNVLKSCAARTGKAALEN